MKESSLFVVCKDKFGREYQIPKEQLQFRIAVCGILIKNNTVLLIPDQTTAKLELPGGAVKKGESLEDSLFREFHEETGLAIIIKRLLTYRESFYFMKNPDTPFQTLRLFFSVTSLNSVDKIINGAFVNVYGLTQDNTSELTYSVLKQLHSKK